MSKVLTKPKVTSPKHTILSIGLCMLVGLIWLFIPHPLVGVVVGLIPIAILIVLSQTFWLVTLFIVFSFFRIHEVFPTLYPLKIPLMLSAAALSALLWHTLISGKIKLYWHPVYRWLFVFWASLLLELYLQRIEMLPSLCSTERTSKS